MRHERSNSLKICGRNIKVQGRLIRIGGLDADKYQFLDDPDPVINELRKSGERIDLFTFMQKLPESCPKYRYPMEWDNLAAVPVSTFEHWWTHQIGFKARNKAKQAEKNGVTIREVPFDHTLTRGIWEVYNECPVRQGKPFAHFGKDLETVRKEEATYLESSIFLGAFLNDALIGFAKLTWDETRTQAGLMNIVSMIRHRDKAPTNALIAQAVRSCAERGIAYLVYSNFSYGKKQRDSLSDFKERNGFQRVNLPRYYVPLTRLGWAALHLGLHKKLWFYCPESIATRLRELRNAWYDRKIRSLTEVT
jgi:hypothetical protein